MLRKNYEERAAHAVALENRMFKLRRQAAHLRELTSALNGLDPVDNRRSIMTAVQQAYRHQDASSASLEIALSKECEMRIANAGVLTKLLKKSPMRIAVLNACDATACTCNAFRMGEAIKNHTRSTGHYLVDGMESGEVEEVITEDEIYRLQVTDPNYELSANAGFTEELGIRHL